MQHLEAGNRKGVILEILLRHLTKEVIAKEGKESNGF